MINRSEILLAGLLHDIGKFYQRADPDNSYQKSKILSDSSKTMEEVVRYKHVLWTNEFLTKQADLFEQKLFPKDSEQRKLSYRLALKHHNPTEFDEALFALADRMASGMDRTQSSTQEHTEKDYELFKKTPLVPIFENLLVASSHTDEVTQKTEDKKENKTRNWGYPLCPLSLRNEIFPREQSAAKINQADYATLWDQFTKDLSCLPTEDLDRFNESFLALLKKYTWCIPASTMDFPSSSLYDHTKMVAAMAVCLFAYHDTENNIQEKWYRSGKIDLPDDVYPFLFLNTELTGIQSFLYNINSNKAARALKGRSFFLNLLIDTVKTRVLHDLGLSSAHVVYASGGKCYFLLPNTKEVRSKLDDLEAEIVRQLHQDPAIGDELYVCFGRQAFGMSHEKGSYKFQYNLEGVGTNKTLSDLWKAVGNSASAKKSQKYKSLLKTNFSDFFCPQGGNSDEVCALTGLFFDDDKDCVNLRTITNHDDENQEPINVKRSVYDQVKIGKNLQTAEYILTCVAEISPEKEAKLAHISDYSQPLKLGVHTFIYSEKDTESKELLKQMPDIKNHTYRIHSLNDYNFDLPQNLKEIKGIIDPKLYGGNQQASYKNGRLKDFSQLAEGKDEDAFSRLAVLRMDVDGLGQIFIKGMPPAEKSFSAYATLSSMLDWFFSGYLNTIQKKYTNVNILYSGGDDVFAMGKWDEILLFAEDVRNEFRKFVCNREEISISAGVALVKPKFPIAKAADMAGEYEDIAKEYETEQAYAGKNSPDFSLQKLGIRTKEKNAICVFGIPVCWDHEWCWVKAMKDDLVRWLNDKTLSRAVLHKIQLFYDQSHNEQTISWRWHAAYHIGRQRNKNNKQAIDFLEELWLNDRYTYKKVDSNGKDKQIVNMGSRALSLLTVAARWAELETRGTKKKELTS